MEPTLIDAQADIEGTLKGKDAQILGRFKGQVQVTGRLVLGETSRVDARVTADVAEVGGEFRGEIKARSVTLTEKARVEGRLDAQVLVVRDGARLNGDVVSGRDAPSVAVAL
jgi:cytoskeletal protein CcmA (bactofilin family)